MVHSYYDALTVIALFRVVNSKTLTLLFQDHTLRSHFIQKALSKKHVRKATVQERVNGERKSLTLFSITWKGLNYIAQKDSGLYELLANKIGGNVQYGGDSTFCRSEYSVKHIQFNPE